MQRVRTGGAIESIVIARSINIIIATGSGKEHWHRCRIPNRAIGKLDLLYHVAVDIVVTDQAGGHKMVFDRYRVASTQIEYQIVALLINMHILRAHIGIELQHIDCVGYATVIVNGVLSSATTEQISVCTCPAGQNIVARAAV